MSLHGARREVIDFVEENQYAKEEKIDYDSTIRSTVLDTPVEITAWTLNEALGIEGTKTSASFKTVKEFDAKYMVQHELTKYDINSDGFNVKGYDLIYQDMIQAMVEVSCVKKKFLYANI